MAINVLVVNSHSGGDRVWRHLDANWMNYGTTKLSLTITNRLSYDLLCGKMPDVVVCGDTAGSPYQFTHDEFEAIERYMRQGVGHHLLGTYALFFHEEGNLQRRHQYDNRRLARLFGINPRLAMTTQRLPGKPEFRVLSPGSILWKNVPALYRSNGYESTQIPTTHRWTDDALASTPDSFTQIVAHTEDDRCVIVNHVEPTFSSLYISTMPEYESLTNTFVDCQFLYNAFCFLVNQSRFPSSHRQMSTSP